MTATMLPTTREEVRALPAAAKRPKLYKPMILRIGDVPWLTPLRIFVIVAALTCLVSWLLGTPIATALNTAYGLAIVNYLVRRQQRLLTRMRASIALDDAHFKYEWYALVHFRHIFIIGFGLLAPAALVAVNWNSVALRAIFSGHAFPPAYLWSFSLAMLDWFLIMQVLVIIFSNALRFYRLGRDHTRIDLLDTSALAPYALAGAAVLTYRFWTTSLNSDATVIGKTIRLGPRTATVVGVLEPSIPYPADTEIIANVVTSPHHLGATMATRRTHRMTELFGRLAPGVSLDAARAELTSVHAAMMREHPDSYSAKANVQLKVARLREQIAAPARTILLVLLAAAAVVFVIACSNVANLILARSVRREGELAVRAALGAGHGALRRTLLAESLVLCGAGAVLGVVLAQPLVAMVSRYAARFSIRALDVTVDSSVLWIGAGLAMAAAVLLAYVPRLPSPHAPAGLGLTNGSVRITPGTNRRLRLFATTQIAFSFVLLAGAGMLLATLVAMRTATTGYNMRQVLAFDIPTAAAGMGGAKVVDFYQEATRRIAQLPGVEGVTVGSFVPWRDAGSVGPGFAFTVEGYKPADGEENPHGRIRLAAPRFFAVLGVPLLAGRDFTDDDRDDGEPVSIVSQSVAQRLFPNGEAINRHMWWTDPYFGKPTPRRIVGVVADVDDENVVRGSAQTIYMPVRQIGLAGRLFVRAAGDPYALVPSVTRVIREISPDQPVERAATLEDVRAEVLSPAWRGCWRFR